MDEDELVERIGDYALIGLRSKTHITPRVLDAASKLVADRRLLHRHQPDRSRRRLRAGPRRLQRAVLQHPLGRRAGDQRDHRDDPPAHREERPDARRRVGQVGLAARTRSAAGRWASSATATSAPSCRCWPRAWACRSSSTTPPTGSPSGNARRCLSMKDVLVESDVVTLHVDGRPQNESFFGEDEFAAMKPGSLFLNLSRGFVVDYASLRRAHRVRPHRRRRRRRLPQGAEGPRRTSSSPSCAACPTSSSPRTSAARPRRRRRTSAASSPASSRDFVQNGSTAMSRERPAAAAAPRPTARCGWCTCTATSPACWRGSTACSPTTA